VTPGPHPPHGGEGGAASLRARLRAPLAALLLLAVTGVLVAALLRPFVGAPSPSLDRALQHRASETPPVVSLDDLRRERRRARDDASGEQPAQVAAVIGVGTGTFAGADSSPDVVDPDGPPDPSELRPPSDADVQRELAAFRDHIEGMDPRRGARAYIDSHGRAVLPKGAPRVVALVVAAANEIATRPYKWGGGHGAWKDSGYDCSGSVSFALAGARLLDRPLDSSGLMRFGSNGPGRWITIYANPGHVFMTVAGLRFDTSGQSSGGTRWQRGARPTGGYTVRHPKSL
jgi:cell wall-associated NlpC family hydrolase